MNTKMKKVAVGFLTVAVVVGLASQLSGCGKVGPMGSAGSVGPQGLVGPSGTPGSDADSWTVVQLCPGTTHYPNTFCEVTFCFQGNLYGTYSANDGFSSELPQGQYSSNGINCSCTVTIGPNCQVSN